MCGICGIIGFDEKRPVGAENIQPLLEEMCQALYHRGPDEGGTFIEGNVGLGMRRLSIIDLKTGHQPIHNEDKTIWVVHKGEESIPLRDSSVASLPLRWIGTRTVRNLLSIKE